MYSDDEDRKRAREAEEKVIVADILVATIAVILRRFGQKKISISHNEILEEGKRFLTSEGTSFTHKVEGDTLTVEIDEIDDEFYWTTDI